MLKMVEDYEVPDKSYSDYLPCLLVLPKVISKVGGEALKLNMTFLHKTYVKIDYITYFSLSPVTFLDIKLNVNDRILEKLEVIMQYIQEQGFEELDYEKELV